MSSEPAASSLPNSQKKFAMMFAAFLAIVLVQMCISVFTKLYWITCYNKENVINFWLHNWVNLLWHCSTILFFCKGLKTLKFPTMCSEPSISAVATLPHPEEGILICRLNKQHTYSFVSWPYQKTMYFPQIEPPPLHPSTYKHIHSPFANNNMNLH